MPDDQVQNVDENTSEEERDAIARAKLEEARNTNDSSHKKRLLQEAAELTEDKSLQNDIDAELAGVSRENNDLVVIAQLQWLKTPPSDEGYTNFVGALKILEGLADDGYEFRPNDKSRINNARKWYTEKRLRDTNSTSLSIQGSLIEKYYEFNKLLNNKNPDPFYIDENGIKLDYPAWLAKSKESWLKASSESCENLLKTELGKTATASPNGAKRNLQKFIGDEIDWAVDEGKRKIRIKRNPLGDQDVANINSYLSQLEIPCDQEQKALKLMDQAISAPSYKRYELLLQARAHSWNIPEYENLPKDPKTYILPNLDSEIYGIYGAAAAFRYEEIKGNLDALDSELNEAPKLSKSVISSQLYKILQDLNTIFSDTLSWPGAGQKLSVSIENKVIDQILEFPASLKTLGVRCQETIARQKQMKSAYDRLISEDATIRANLLSSDSDKRTEGLNAFKLLENNELVSNFLIFEELKSFVVQQTSFEDGQRQIQKAFTEENWTSVIRLCKDFKEKDNYQKKCPAEIKKDVEAWRITADHNLRFQRFQYFVKQENYQSAEEVLETLKAEKVNLQSISVDMEKLESVKTSGKDLWDFYVRTLSAYNLDKHVFREILRNPDGARAKLEQYESDPSRVVRSIIGDQEGAVPQQEYEKNLVIFLTGYLQKWSFEQKTSLLNSVNYIVGLPCQNPDTKWPALTPASYAKYEARLLSQCLTTVIQQEAFRGIQEGTNNPANNLLAATAKIESVYAFKFPLNDSEQEVLKKVEILNAEARAAQLLPDQVNERVAIWETVKEHLGHDQRITKNYRSAKIEWFVQKVKRLSANKEFDEALKTIVEGFNDDNVGTVWQLYLESVYTYMEMEKFDDARKALSEVVRIKARTSEVKKLEVDIEIGERVLAYRDFPVSLIRSLADYLRDPSVIRNYKGSIEQSLQANFQKNLSQYLESVRRNIDIDRVQALHSLLDLRKMEDIYLEVKPGVSRASQEYIERLLPTFYRAGASLIEEGESFNGRFYNNGISMDGCLSDGVQLQDRLASFIDLINGLFRQEKSSQITLDQVIRQVIQKIVTEKEKQKDLSGQLDRYVQEDTKNKKRQMFYHELVDHKTDLDAKLQQIHGWIAKLEDATLPDLWLSPAIKALNGENGSWKQIEDKDQFKECEQFAEVIKFRRALSEWKNQFPGIYSAYNSLRNKYQNESFEEAKSCAHDLSNRIDALPAFSNPEKKDQVIGELKKKIQVQNNHKKYFEYGLAAIFASITDLQQEILSWEGYRNKKQKELARFSGALRDFKNKVVGYQKDFTKYKSFLLVTTQSANKIIEDYISLVEKIELWQSDKNTGVEETNELGDFMPIPEPDIVDRSFKLESSSSPSPKKNGDGGSFGLFKLFNFGSSGKHSADNRFLEGIRLSAQIEFPLFRHLVEVDAIHRGLEKVKDGGNGLAVNTSISKMLSDECDEMSIQKRSWEEQLDEILKKNIESRTDRPFPGTKTIEVEFKKYYEARQYPNLARKIIEADLIGTKNADEQLVVDTFRDTLIKIWS